MFIKKHEPLKVAFNAEFSYFTPSFRHVFVINKIKNHKQLGKVPCHKLLVREIWK